MLVSVNWLNEFIDSGLQVEDMSHALTMAGLEIEGMEPSGDDHVLEVNVTPNRSDCLSVLGIARELRAITGNAITLPDHSVGDTGSTGFKLQIKDEALCNRYAGRVVRGVNPGPSPGWMKQRLEICGIRSINNIVDITNYVLLEFGHPLHAFDLATLKGGCIKVAVAGKDSKFRTLDELERKLPEDALMIWDGERPVAVAGVMGGAETEVGDSTVDIFIESAWFEPFSIRRTSKTLGLSTEASYRFERGTDPVMLEVALNRAARLVAELAGGTVEAKVDAWPVKPATAPIRARTSFINRLLGLKLSDEETLDILGRLDLKVTREGDAMLITPPPYRPDLAIEADIAEEVARLYGYDNIPTVMPVANISPMAGQGRERKLLASIKSLFNAAGYHDTINYSFMNAAHLDLLRIADDDDRRKSVKVANPLRAEDELMRTTLVPSLVSNLSYNIAQGADGLRLFEAAKVFINRAEQLPEEPHKIGGVYFEGNARTLYPENAEPFFALKGTLESVLDMLRIADVSYVPSAEPFFHPGKCADIMVAGKRAGYMGVLAPAVMEGFDIKAKQEAVVFELDTDILFDATPEKPDYSSIARYPSVQRDIALYVDKGVSVEQVLEAIRSSAPDFFESASLFDFYTGKGVPDGKKSLAFNIVYRSPEKTLTDNVVESAHKTVLDAVINSTGGEQRA